MPAPKCMFPLLIDTSIGIFSVMMSGISISKLTSGTMVFVDCEEAFLRSVALTVKACILS